ncbi:MAG: ribonuclease P protein component [Chloroflexota bacterium]|nr:ribonuclease P protein component [Chloroflexota bacterium]
MERRLRLRDEADFRRLRAGGRAWSGRLMTLLALPNAEGHNRYGLIVSKRVGKAVERNLIKRRLREIVRQLDRDGRIAQGYDLALIVRPALAAADFAAARDATIALLKRGGLLLVPATPATTPAEGKGHQR